MLHTLNYLLIPIPALQATDYNFFSYFKTFVKVEKELDNFLFKLVILRAVKDHSGNVWRRKSTDMYVVEITIDKSFEALTVVDPSSDQNYSQVGLYCLTCLRQSCQTIITGTTGYFDKLSSNSG